MILCKIMIYKKNIAGFVVFLVLAGLLTGFRGKIASWLSFEKEPTVVPVAKKKIVEAVVPPVSAPAPDKKSISAVLPLADKTPEKPKIPMYTGRDPAEVRPVPEEVRLFSEDQRQQIYSALKTHGQSVKAQPKYFWGWIQVGLVKKTIGDFEGSRDAWEYAGLIEPLNSLSFSNLGELYWRYLPDYPKSEQSFRTSIKHKPNDWQNYISLAELYHYSYKEKYDLADDVLLEGLQNNPGDGNIMRRLAYLYEQREEWDKALDWWKKILETSPDDEEVKLKIEKDQAKIISP